MGRARKIMSNTVAGNYGTKRNREGVPTFGAVPKDEAHVIGLVLVGEFAEDGDVPGRARAWPVEPVERGREGHACIHTSGYMGYSRHAVCPQLLRPLVHGPGGVAVKMVELARFAATFYDMGEVHFDRPRVWERLDLWGVVILI